MIQNSGLQPVGGNQLATLGGGCFWCLEAVYDELNGVDTVVSGYSGGSVANPSYEDVVSGRTGHAEVVQITFDPVVVSFKEVLEVFFTIHDPTTLNRQGPDVGAQYRSAVFCHDDGQKRVAEEVMRDLAGRGLWEDPIVTEVTPIEAFYAAEEYHQDYFKKHPFQPYCLVIIRPKVAKFRQKYLANLKKRTA